MKFRESFVLCIDEILDSAFTELIKPQNEIKKKKYTSSIVAVHW